MSSIIEELRSNKRQLVEKIDARRRHSGTSADDNNNDNPVKSVMRLVLFGSLAVLDPRVSTPWTYFLHLFLSSVMRLVQNYY